MEYRRRRSRRRKKEGDTGFALKVFLLLIVFGCIAYALIGTGLAKRIRDGYALSLYDSCRSKQSLSSPSAPISSVIPATASPTAAPTGETAEVSLPGIEVYMIQMGIYSDEQSARAAAASLKQMGAAGCVFDDNGSLRLIAAAFSDEASAASVRTRLESEGHECSVFKLSRSGAELDITADPSRLVPIRTAFTLAADVVTQLDELAIDFDASSRSMEYGLDVLSEIRSNVISARAGVGEAAQKNEVLGLVDEYLNDVLDMTDDAASASFERTAFSSALKALRVRAALRYAELLGRIGG